MKLRSKMMLAICIPVMVVLVLLSGVAYWQASRALSEEIRMEMSQASARYAEAVQTILSTKQETVGSLAAAWSVSLPADEEILRTVTYLTKNTPGAQDIYVAFPSKKFIDGTGWVPPADMIRRQGIGLKTLFPAMELCFPKSMLMRSPKNRLSVFPQPYGRMGRPLRCWGWICR